MSATSRAIIIGCQLLAAILGIYGIGIPALSAASSIVFAGLPHTAIGSAVLHLDSSRGVLEVQPLDPGGRDGVRVALPETTGWTARMSAADPLGASLQMTWNALADGRAISTASMRQNDSRFELRGTFTGGINPTYAAQVYDAGQLVGSVGSVPPTAHLLIPISFCYIFPDLFDCGFTTEFHNSANSECEWRFVFNTRMPITLPNGAVAVGNEVRLVEEVNPAGHYPYLTFDAINVRSNTRLLTLFSETAR